LAPLPAAGTAVDGWRRALQRPGLQDANIRVFLWLDEGSWPAAWGNDEDNNHYNSTMAAKNVDGTFTFTFKQS